MVVDALTIDTNTDDAVGSPRPFPLQGRKQDDHFLSLRWQRVNLSDLID